jgi:hypothetical protein
MAKIVRHEFLGSWLIFWGLCLIVFLWPIAFLYWKAHSIRIEEDMDSPEDFVEQFRSGKLTNKT